MFKLKPLALLSLSALLAGCVTSQSLNSQAALAYQQTISQERSKGTVDTTSNTAKRIHRIFNKMLPIANRANNTGVPFNWELTVVKSNELNAWAMPGGKMMFYTGIVDKLNLTDDEIATIMGHEMAHALKEHSKSAATLSNATSIAGSLGKAVLQSQGVSTDLGNGMDMVDLAAEFGLNRPFSRSHETEADEVGLALMAEACFDPAQAPKLWDKMSAASGSSGSLLEAITSTHPINDVRKANLTRLIPNAEKIRQASGCR